MADVHGRRLGLGCAQLGNLYRAIADDRAAATVAAAWDAGIRYFDTAPHYGLGLSERRLGAALRDRPRDEFTISTKVGRRLEPRDHRGETDTEDFVVPATLLEQPALDDLLPACPGPADRRRLCRVRVHPPGRGGCVRRAASRGRRGGDRRRFARPGAA